MSFEERLRRTFERIDERVDDEGLDWNSTIRRARRSRTIHMAGAVAGIAALLALGSVGARAVLVSQERNPIPGPAATTGDPSPDPAPSPEPECSGEADYGSFEFEGAADADLPKAVRDTMEAIIEAAKTCDYARLERLALAGDGGFNYSFGGGDEPARYWRRLENEEDPALREEVTSIMITLLNMRHTVDCMSASIGCAPGDEDLYIWPRVFDPEAGSKKDWQELVEVGLYTQEEVDEMRKSDLGYIGYRFGILKDGDWIYFVAGD